eukprot:TRINITY_DN7269_c0_g1_i1.p1 TRINITY_DN7269_c0_g1~~TRINITY_DN7269_c0_g1_i1.p1  ORF type:complete len:413 (+),score=110.11 TRINITY_DN7269_c0_g1_i1:50-1288(+)
MDPNKFKEPAFLMDGLSLFEQHIKPRIVVADESTTALPVRSLNKELTCPVCLGIIHNTLTVMECLHRFCSNCISKSLRIGKKECPSCRIPVLSRRNLRPDPSFDALIKNLYPNLDAFEAKEEEAIQKINKTFSGQNLRSSVSEGIKRQSQAKRTRAKAETANEEQEDPDEDSADEERERKKKAKAQQKKKPAKTASPLMSPGLSSPSIATVTTHTNRSKLVSQEPEVHEIGVVLLPHPSESVLPRLDRPFLRLTASARVSHLAKFLALRFASLVGPSPVPTPDKDATDTNTENDVKEEKDASSDKDNGEENDGPSLDIHLTLGDFVTNVIPYVLDRNRIRPPSANPAGEGAPAAPSPAGPLPTSHMLRTEGAVPTPVPLPEDTSLISLRDTWNRRDDIIVMYYADTTTAPAT